MAPLLQLCCALLAAAAPARGAVRVAPGGSIAAALAEAAALGELEVEVPAGRYATAHAPLYLAVNRSVHVRGVGGPAVIDCEGNSSGLEIALSTGLDVSFSGVEFRNCVSRVFEHPRRHWEVGPRKSWCGSCWCMLELCSKGGAVTITNPAEVLEVSNVSITFANCSFEGNSASKGGAVAFGLFANLSRSSLRFEDCRFLRNEARDVGGPAVDVMLDGAWNSQYYGPRPIPGRRVPTLATTAVSFQGCSFRDNHGASEGSVALWSSAGYLAGLDFSVRDSEFLRNRGGNGAALSFHVGALAGGEMNTVLLDNVLFEDNVAGETHVGGAVLATLPMAEMDPDPPKPMFYRSYSRGIQFITRNSIFRRNRAYIGGAYSIGNGRHAFYNTSFVDNHAQEGGGAICLGCIGGGDAQFDCEDTDFRGNVAETFGATFSSQSTGSISIRRCRFDMAGSDQGVTDFDFNNAGPFHADSNTSWQCGMGHRLLLGHDTVSVGTSGNLDPSWNSMSIDVKINRMQLGCMACSINRYTMESPVLTGPVYAYSDSTTDPERMAIAQGGGNYAEVQCHQCHSGEFLKEGQCHLCPAGRTMAKGGGLTEEACGLDPLYFLLAALLALDCAAVAALASLAAGCSVPIRDITLEKGGVVVSTCGRHRLLPRGWAEIRLRLRRTGHPRLDGREPPFGARVLDGERLALLDERGEPVDERLDSSMGCLQVCWWRAPLCTGILNVPVLAELLVLLTAAVLIGRLSRLTAAAGLLATGLGALAGVALVLWRQLSATAPLARRLWEFRRSLPAPRPCQRGPERAITAGQLFHFYNYFQGFIRDRDMHFACANIIRPLTEPEQLSYAELVGPSRVTFFVSHYWGTQLRHFVESIERHAEQAAEGRGLPDWRSLSYWICSFGNNQWDIQGELSVDCEESSFYLALRSGTCRGTAMVLDEKALPLTRSWCLFELVQTFLLSAARPAAFEGLALCTPRGVLNHGGTGVDIAMGVAQRLSTLCLEDATASNKQDKVMIDSRVQRMQGGFPAMNKFVRENIRDALMKVKDSFEDDFGSIVAALEHCTEEGARAGEGQGHPRLLGREENHIPASSQLQPLGEDDCCGDVTSV